MTEFRDGSKLLAAEEHARKAIDEIANEGGLDEITFESYGPPVWVVSGRDAIGRKSALHVEYSDDPQALLEEQQAGVALMRQLREHGGQVIDYTRNAWIQPHPRITASAFVVTQSVFLPTGDVTPVDFGGGVGSMHRAGAELNLNHLQPLQPFTRIRRAAEALRLMHDEGRPFTAGDLTLREAVLDSLETHLPTGEKAHQEMFVLAKEKGRPLVPLLWDVHAGNTRYDAKKVATIFDVPPFVGPAEIDLGRPFSDWKRFGQPLSDTQQYLHGYVQAVSPDSAPSPTLLPDKEILQHAIVASNIAFSSMMLVLAYERASQSKPNEWLLREGEHRLLVIDDPDAQWQPFNTARKNQEFAQQ